MKIHTLFVVAVSYLVAGATALSNGQPKSRRAALAEVTGAAAAVVGGSSVLLPTAANAAVAKGAEAFCGTFTDPINHPGGTRTISLLEGKTVGDYQLAEVTGGGGRGEPANYVLPAAVLGDRLIVIDFSPKGGPRDFVGILDKGDIKFLKDGNRWPRQ